MSFDVETVTDAAGRQVEVIVPDRAGPYIGHLPPECLVTHCQIGDRSGFLCIGEDSVERAKAALDRVAISAGVMRRAVLTDPADRLQHFTDRRGHRRIVGGFYGIGWIGNEYFQKFVTYDQALTDDESDAIKLALGARGVTDAHKMLGGPQSVIVIAMDETTPIGDEREFWDRIRRR